MKTKRVLMLGLIIALLLATFAAGGAYAQGAVVPFRAYYPVNAVANFDPLCMCMRQHFEPGGDGKATHMGLSQLYGDADAWQLGEILIQKGTATLIAANGDFLTVYYEGEARVLADGQHIRSIGWYVVTGGGGRFEGATGEGKYEVYVYMNGEQPNDLWFEGVLNEK